MDHSESSDLPFDERRKSKPQKASANALNSVEESSHATETTAAATVSTLPSYSESKVTHRQRHSRTDLFNRIAKSDTKLAGLQKEWDSMSPKRLFQASSNAAKNDNSEGEDKGDSAFSSNDTKSNTSVSLPQEQLNDLVIVRSESSELSAETEHLRYLREKVERQVQSMSQLLLESPSNRRNQRHQGSPPEGVAKQQFQALSKQVLVEYMDDPKDAFLPSQDERLQKHRKRDKAAIPPPQPIGNTELALKEAKSEIDELQRQLMDHERSSSLPQGDADPQVVLLHQQRSKLQRRIRELLHDIAELRQERNSYQMQCLEQSRRIHTLEDSFRQLEEEKKDSEKGLYRYISALQDKSTQLLEDLQESRQMLQNETQSRIETSIEAKQRIGTLESEKKRFQRTISRYAEATTTDLGRSKQPTTTSDQRLMLPDQPVISNMEAIAGNDNNNRIEKMRSEVQLRRAKIDAIRQKRSDEEKSSPPNKSTTVTPFRNRNAPPSPVSMKIYTPPRSQERSVRSPMSLTTDHADDPPGMQLFLQRIDAAMEEGAASFANQNMSMHLQQELLDLKNENAELKLGIEEAEENASVLELTARETTTQLQEAVVRKEKLANDLKDHRASVEAAKTELVIKENELKEYRQELEHLSTKLSERQKECHELKERAKKFQGLELGHSTLLGVIQSHKSQNRAMSSQIDALEMTVMDLEMANGSLQDHVVVLEGDLKQQEGLISKLSGDLSASSSREASTRKDLEAATGARDVLQGKIAGISIEVEGLQQEKTALEGTVKQLESIVSTAEAKQLEMTEKLGASAEDLSKTKEETAKLTEEVDTLQQEMKKLRTEKGAQAMALSHAEQVQSELASRLAASEVSLKEQAESAMLQDEEVSRLIEKCLGIKSETSTLTTEEGSQDKAAASKERQSIESKLSLEVAQTSERRRVLERQLQDLNSQFQLLRQGGEAIGTQTDGLGKNFNLRSLDSAIGKLRMECDQLVIKNFRLQDQNDAMKQLVSDSEQLRKEMEKITFEREKELESLRQTRVASEAEKTALQTERKQLAAELDIYASIEEELEARLADATRLIDSSLPKIKELEAKVEALNKDVTGRDIVLKEMDKEKVSLTEKLEALKNAVEFWVQKCSDIESAHQATKEEDKPASSDSLVLRVKVQLLRLSDVKAEVMKQLFRTAGNVDYESSKPAAETTDDILADIEDLHFVLDTASQFIVASREATTNLDRTIESLRDEKSLLVTRNTTLERIVEEQRTQSNEFEKLLSTMRVVPSVGSVGSYSVAVQSRAVQTEPTEDVQNLTSTGTDTTEQVGEDDNMSERDKVMNEHERLRSQLDSLNDGPTRSMSPISEINTNDDAMSSLSWTELSEVDSKNDSLNRFPASDDMSDLSPSTTLEPIDSFLWKEPEVDLTYSMSEQAPSTQLETIASAENFGQLRTPRVSNSAHPDRIGRQQQPPEYNITLGALSPAREPSPIDRYAIEESSEFGKQRTKSFDFK